MTKEELIAMRRETRLTLRELAKRTGLSYTKVRELTQGCMMKQKASSDITEEVSRLYKDGVSMNEIARRFDMSYYAVRNILGNPKPVDDPNIFSYTTMGLPFYY